MMLEVHAEGVSVIGLIVGRAFGRKSYLDSSLRRLRKRFKKRNHFKDDLMTWR